jgi:hypothetical protein
VRTFYRGWDGLRKTLGPRSHFLSLTDYFLYGRCLPVVLMLASMFVTMAVGRLVLPHAMQNIVTRWRNVFEDKERFLQCPSPMEVPLLEAQLLGGIVNNRGHHVFKRRPDFEELVRVVITASECATKHLVVSVCGPATLVEMVRKAVVVARKADRRGIRLEFSGSDPNW